MSKIYVETFGVFYNARLALLNKAKLSSSRTYEDDKIRITLKRTIFPDDTVTIFLKMGESEERVYEVALCPLPFRQSMFDQIYLKGNWENYLEKVGKQAHEELERHHDKVDSFSEFVYKFGPSEDPDMPVIKLGEIDDAKLFITEGDESPFTEDLV